MFDLDQESNQFNLPLDIDTTEEQLLFFYVLFEKTGKQIYKLIIRRLLRILANQQ